MAQQRRGYYEELDVGGMDNWRWQGAEEPEGWSKGRKAFYRERSDFLLKDILPSMSTVLGGAPATSNSLGMRDREYQKAKPANTYRIVLLGASNDMGTGVKDDQTYENLVEDDLNSRAPDARYSRYEILNLSVAADSILQRALRLEEEGFQFQPDAAILSVTAVDEQFIASHLRKALVRGIEPSGAYADVVQSVIRRAGVNAKMPAVMIERRLQPYVTELCEWSFQRFAQQCAQHGVHPIVMYRPAPVDFSGFFKAPTSNHLFGLLGGVLWGVAMVFNLVAADFTGTARSYAIGQSAPMIAALWGIFIWKEFAGAPGRAKMYLVGMFAFYCLAISLVAIAK